MVRVGVGFLFIQHEVGHILTSSPQIFLGSAPPPLPDVEENMGITRSLLPKKIGNLPLPFLCPNYPIGFLFNIYLFVYMYINWFNWIIFFMIVYVIQTLGVT